jgi:hypothetical protein
MSYLTSFNPFIERRKKFQTPNSLTNELPYLPSSNHSLKEEQFQNPNPLTNELPPFLQSIHKKKKAISKSKIPHQSVTSLPLIRSLKE